MKNIRFLLAAVLICGLFITTGCGTVQKVISPELVRQGTAASVSFSADQWPDAVPGIRIGQEVICKAASGEDISPKKIMADVQLLAGQLTAGAKAGINGAMFLYTGVYNSFGDDAVNNVPTLKIYLQSTCDGITDGLPAVESALTSESTRSRATATSKWPMVR